MLNEMIGGYYFIERCPVCGNMYYPRYHVPWCPYCGDSIGEIALLKTQVKNLDKRVSILENIAIWNEKELNLNNG